MKTEGDVTILFVDDEVDLLSSLRRFLRREPYRTLFADSGKAALKTLASEPVDIIVSDLRMPEMDGLALLTTVKTDYPEVIRLILSASRDVEQTIEAINAGEVYRFVSKPLDPEPFKRTLLEIVDYHLLVAGRRDMMSEVEKSLLQAPPPQGLACARVAALMVPAGHPAGDFCDYFVYDDRRLDILIGDMTGKGFQSALVAAGLKHQFAKSLAVYDCRNGPRVSCPHDSNSQTMGLAQVVAGVHTESMESLMDLGIFATLSYSRIDLAAGRFGLVDCGHVPVIHFQAANGRCTYVKGENTAFGMAYQANYKEVTTNLSPGDVLLFYSDGVTETLSDDGEMFGIERLAELVQTNHHLPPGRLTETIKAETTAFSARGRFDDDFTCIVVYID
ncbi:MAG: SpoIIE family protein phosphatase [Proteobacteria bacterium]|nr:SpoIIE family protein phosphatase [Pseudomonadota bacterium]